MPGLNLALAHSPKCGSELREFGRHLRRLQWELPNCLVSTISSANSEKARIVVQLLA
jgi:hypothetical protein